SSRLKLRSLGNSGGEKGTNRPLISRCSRELLILCCFSPAQICPWLVRLSQPTHDSDNSPSRMTFHCDSFPCQTPAPLQTQSELSISDKKDMFMLCVEGKGNGVNKPFFKCR